MIDIDDDEGRKAIREILPCSITPPSVQTPKGGKHLYFATPVEPLPNNARVIPGCHFRGEGGYVVAPPSVGSNGKQYQWAQGHSIADAPPPPLPDAYIKRITSAVGGPVASGNNCTKNISLLNS